MNTLLKLVAAVVLVTLPVISRPQEVVQVPKTLNCLKLSVIFKFLSTEYNEEPLFVGDDTGGKSKYIMTLNPKTKTWTIIEYEGNMGCILGTGNKAMVNIDILLKNGVKL